MNMQENHKMTVKYTHLPSTHVHVLTINVLCASHFWVQNQLEAVPQTDIPATVQEAIASVPDTARFMSGNECKVRYIACTRLTVWETYQQQCEPLSSTTSVGLAHARPCN